MATKSISEEIPAGDGGSYIAVCHRHFTLTLQRGCSFLCGPEHRDMDLHRSR